MSTLPDLGDPEDMTERRTSPIMDALIALFKRMRSYVSEDLRQNDKSFFALHTQADVHGKRIDEVLARVELLEEEIGVERQKIREIEERMLVSEMV